MFNYTDLNKTEKIKNLKKESTFGQNHTRWRNNVYINEDGLLPYSLCGSDNQYIETRPVHSKFIYNNVLYTLLILATSVWGASTSNGKPIQLNEIEFLIFFTYSDTPCEKCGGDHCKLPHDIPLPLGIDCKFYFSNSFSFQSKGKIMPNIENRFGATPAAIARCPMFENETMMSMYKTRYNVDSDLFFFDQWNVSIFLTENEENPAHVAVCYQHVKKTLPLVACTQPMYGYLNFKHDAFWIGDPPYQNHTLLHAFLYYHIFLLGIHVRFNDFVDEFRKAILSLDLQPHQLSYRSNWNLQHIMQNNNGQYDFEILAESMCHWEMRLISNWSIIIHSVDNFLLPNSSSSLFHILNTLHNRRVSSMIIPTTIGISCCEPRKGHNVLQQYNKIGQSLMFGDSRHTPLCNPRHMDWTYVHWNLGRNELFRSEIQHFETVETFDLQTLHIMELTRHGLYHSDVSYSNVFLDACGYLIEHDIENMIINFGSF